MLPVRRVDLTRPWSHSIYRVNTGDTSSHSCPSNIALFVEILPFQERGVVRHGGVEPAKGWVAGTWGEDTPRRLGIGSLMGTLFWIAAIDFASTDT